MKTRLLTRATRCGAIPGALAVALLFSVPGPALGQAPRDLHDWTLPLGDAGPEIGVTVRDVTADDAAASKGGAVVESVRAESAAAKAGVQAGDVVVTFDGEPVRSARQLARLIDETPRDREVSMSVVRSGKNLNLSVAPEARSAREMPWRAIVPGAAERDLVLRPRGPDVLSGLFNPPGAARLGIQIQDLTPQLGEYFGAATGVLVASVSDGMPAKAAGLRAGDVITEVNGEPVEDGAALRQRTANAAGSLAITIVRNRQEQTLNVDLGSRPAEQRAPRRYTR
jgi:serine protease Do